MNEKELVEAAIKGTVMEGAEVSFYDAIGEGDEKEVWFILRKPEFNPKWLYFEAMVKGGKVLFGLHGNIGWEGESTDPNETYRKMLEIGEDSEQ